MAPITAPTSATPLLPTPGGPELLDDLREALPQRPAVGQLEVLDVPGPGVGGPHQQQHPRAHAARGRQERRHGVQAHQRVDGGEVRAEARELPSRRLQATVQRGRIGRRGDVDVAPLAIRDHQQARPAG